MHNLAIGYINLSGVSMSLLNIGLIVLGFVASFLTYRKEWCLRRPLYFLSFAAVSAGVTLSQASWGFITDWTGNVPSIVFALTVIVFLLGGYALGIMSIARSHDIQGDRRSAWMGIVPVASLYLVCKRGRDRPDIERRPALSRFILDPFLVLAGVILLGSIEVLDEVINEYIERRSAAILSTPSGRAEVARQLAAQLQYRLPRRVDEITQVTSVQADGTTLIYTYEVDANIDSFHDDFPSAFRRTFCSPQGFARAIDYGISMQFIYRRAADGYHILELPLDKEICAAT